MQDRTHPTPADVAGAQPDELLSAWEAHAAMISDHRTGVRTQPVGRVRSAALDALAVAHALAAAVLGLRWQHVLVALDHGAELAHVADACGLTVTEVDFSLRRWVDEQVATGGLTPEQRGMANFLLGDRHAPGLRDLDRRAAETLAGRGRVIICGGHTIDDDGDELVCTLADGHRGDHEDEGLDGRPARRWARQAGDAR
ncbi:hypothetical protein [Pseudonocardia sp. WMMC193]|uniref:hypothetical protein n=1 Tax=Pseudonocardia sp. WMMC193 TaxID=2911965 RepID=UPI001F491171|nr:hypothetical protein [Pseudonocardia sp. WMMC193]MCF7550500.1 hypothetical protein [Pseudonocardia sp. WMMC193]